MVASAKVAFDAVQVNLSGDTVTKFRKHVLPKWVSHQGVPGLASFALSDLEARTLRVLRLCLTCYFLFSLRW